MSDPSEHLLGALTLTAIKHLGDNALVIGEDNTLCPEWRMARIGDVALLEKPADDRLPKRIDCFQVVEHSASGDAFKLDLARLVYSLLWKHNDGPAAGGTTVIITGRNFTGATAVRFGAVNAASFTVDSDTQITAVSPPQA